MSEETIILDASPEDFKEWLIKYYWENHESFHKFEAIEKEGCYFYQYGGVQPLPIIKICVQQIAYKLTKVNFELINRPNSDLIIASAYLTEMVAASIKYFEQYEPLDEEEFYRQTRELLGKGEENLFRFLKERRQVQQEKASQGEILKVRYKFLAAQGKANLIIALRTRYDIAKTKEQLRQHVQLKKLLLKLYEELNILKERKTKLGEEVSLRLINEISDYEEAIESTYQAIQGELKIANFQQKLRRLLVSEEVKMLCSDVTSTE